MQWPEQKKEQSEKTEESKPEDTEVKEKVLSEEDKGKTKKVAKTAIDKFRQTQEAYKKGWIRKNRERIGEDLKELDTDPTDWFNDVEDLQPELVRQYQEASANWARAKSRKTGYEAAKKVRDEAYARLEKAVEAHFQKMEQARDAMANAYEERIIGIAAGYDFEKGVALETLTNPTPMILDRTNLVKEARLRMPRTFEQRVAFYLKGSAEVPTKIISKKEELNDLVRGETDNERRDNLEAIWKLAGAEGANPLSTINSWIYYNNYKRFAGEHQVLLRELDQELKTEETRIASLSPDELLA